MAFDRFQHEFRTASFAEADAARVMRVVIARHREETLRQNGHDRLNIRVWNRFTSLFHFLKGMREP